MGMFVHEGRYNNVGFAHINTDWKKKDNFNSSPIDSASIGYINGYKTAADILVSQQNNDTNTMMDMMVFPAFFLYRQYIELLLKKMYENTHSSQEQLVMIKKCGRNIKMLFEHNIDHIRVIIFDFIQEQRPKGIDVIQASDQIFRLIENFLMEINRYDSSLFAFPYSSNRNLAESLPHQISVDLITIKKTVDHIDTIFHHEYDV